MYKIQDKIWLQTTKKFRVKFGQHLQDIWFSPTSHKFSTTHKYNTTEKQPNHLMSRAVNYNRQK